MRRPWNLNDTCIYSLATYHNEQVNMNICTYVIPISMKPKWYAIAIYNNTKSLQNMQNSQYCVLQYLQVSQYNLVNHLVTELGQMANQTKASNPESPSNDNSSVDVALQDSYKNFLRRIAINLPAVNREISAKNPVSKEKIAQFDVRREKNLDFIINEVSIHEILGKF